MPRSLYRRIYVHFLAVLLVGGAASSLLFARTDQGAYFIDVAQQLTAHIAGLLARASTVAERDALAMQLAQELELDLRALG